MNNEINETRTELLSAIIEMRQWLSALENIVGKIGASAALEQKKAREDFDDVMRIIKHAPKGTEL